MIKIPFASGGGVFVPVFTSGTVSISAGATGTLFTLTPPAGQRVRLASLNSSSALEVDITVRISGSIVINAMRLAADGAKDGNFQIGFSAGPLDIDEHYGDIPHIIGGIDEAIQVNAASATAGITKYAYQTGNFR